MLALDILYPGHAEMLCSCNEPLLLSRRSHDLAYLIHLLLCLQELPLWSKAIAQAC